MAEIKWIKITTDMFDDEKIKLIDAMPERDTIFYVWIHLLTQAGKCNAGGYIFLSENMPYTDEMFSTIFNRPINTVRLALKILNDFGMIERSENNDLKITNWEKHQNVDEMQKIREQNRLRKQRQRARLSEKVDVTPMSRDCHATERERDKEEDKDIDKNKKKDIEKEQIESIWKLYPLKKGKANAVKKIPKLLKKHGYKQIERCVERYIRYVEHRQHTDFRELKYQNGSTFFNGTYEDYLDENWKEGNDGTNKRKFEKPEEGQGITL